MSEYCIQPSAVVANPLASNDSSTPRHNDIAQTKQQTTAIYLPPSEFRMKVLKKLVTADRLPESGRGIGNLERQDSNRTLKASIYFPNGEVGTLISYEKGDNISEKDSEANAMDKNSKIPSHPDLGSPDVQKHRRRPLRLPPIILPPIYSMKPLPVVPRDTYDMRELPTSSFTQEDLEDLMECRYIRQYSPRKRRIQSSIVYG